MTGDIPITILYEDDVLLAVDKPSGLPTLPDGYQKGALFLVASLQARYGRLWVVHRLDRGTSGVVVFARTAEAHRALNLQFEQHHADKIYHALVQGVPPWDTQTVDLPLRPDGDRRHRTVVDKRRGKPAVTHLRVLERYPAHALIAAHPETGRTHQIRTHLAVLGFPLVGDTLYTDWHAVGSAAPAPVARPEQAEAARDRRSPLRLGLHAVVLTLLHPATGVVLALEAPYPADFIEALSRALREEDLPEAGF